MSLALGDVGPGGVGGWRWKEGSFDSTWASQTTSKMGLFRFKLDPTKNIDRQSNVNKTAVITGATLGLGRETTYWLAEMGVGRIILAVRSASKGEEMQKELVKRFPGCKVEVMLCDLSDLKSVKSAAESFVQNNETLDILILNAGINPPDVRTLTKDQLELGYQVNHVAGFALIAGLLPALTKSEHARILLLSSDMHYIGKIDFDNLNGERNYSADEVYSKTKLMAVVLAKELARRLPKNVVALSVHPGFCETTIVTGQQPDTFRSKLLKFVAYPLVGRDARSGGANAAWAALTPEAKDRSGDYVCTLNFKGAKQIASDEALGKKLWERSIKDAGLEGVDIGI